MAEVQLSLNPVFGACPDGQAVLDKVLGREGSGADGVTALRTSACKPACQEFQDWS